MDALADAVAEGKARAVGVSNYSAPQMHRAYEALARRGVRLASNQVQYSLLWRQPERNGVLATCQALGVTLNDRPVRVSGAQDLAAARLTVSRKEWQRGLADVCDGLSITPRASLAAKLARVAAGLDDGVFSTIPRKEWGTCAGVALVLAAGGKATLLDGSPIRFNRPELKQAMGMLAAGPELHGALLRWLQRGPVATTAFIDPTERTLFA